MDSNHDKSDPEIVFGLRVKTSVNFGCPGGDWPPELFCGRTHGDDPEQVLKDLRTIVADVVESYKAEGKPLPKPRDLVAALRRWSDLRAQFCHCAPMETHAFGFRLRANAPEGQKRFRISN
jgi:hypothetical protein